MAPTSTRGRSLLARDCAYGLHESRGIFASRYRANETADILGANCITPQHLVHGFWALLPKVLVNTQMGYIDTRVFRDSK